ncbi:hypothetical protein PV797_04355 [Clostridiaceae bacterium M8S5]|nr:hypothetical protein PV797_04355 [Clostridiaceae bacterium M8S5]
MKTLVVYFTRTGYSKMLAENIAGKINADTEQIKDDKNWSGILGYLKGGLYGFSKKMTQIVYSKRPENYDLVIIVAPIWAGSVPPAINTYCKKLKDKINNIAIVLNSESSSLDSTFKHIENLTKKSSANLGVIKKKMTVHDIENKIEKFVEELK